MKNENTLDKLSNDELLRRLSIPVSDSRRVEAELIAHIAEVDARRLYAHEATSSMFVYATDVLHLSEGEAYLRIRVARASRKHPVFLDMLADGRLHLTGAGLLAPHLTPENRDELLARATHCSKRDIEKLVAELQPRSDVPATIRKLPSPAARQLRPDAVEPLASPVAARQPPGELRAETVGPPPATAPPRPTRVEPLAPERYKVEFTASGELREKLARLQALMRSSVPDGDLGAIIEQAVSEKLERLEAKRFGKTRSPRKTLAETDTKASSRYLPAPIRRSVYERDGGRCTFVDEQGRRCRAREWLEYHHEHPYARGGGHNPDNVHLLCRIHNALRAERDYGREWMDQFRSRRKLARPNVARTGP